MSSTRASTSLGGKEHSSKSSLDCNIDTNTSPNKKARYDTTSNAIQPTSNNSGISNNGYTADNTLSPPRKTFDLSTSSAYKYNHHPCHNQPGRVVKLVSGSSSIVIPPESKLLYIGTDYCNSCCSDEWKHCEYVISNGAAPCRFGMYCNYNHDTLSIRHPEIPILSVCPRSVSYGVCDITGLAVITLYDDESGGINDWMCGVDITEENHTSENPNDIRYLDVQWVQNKWWFDIEKMRRDMEAEYNVILPPIIKTPFSILDNSSDAVIHNEVQHIMMQNVLLAITSDILDVPSELREVYAHAETTVDTLEKAEEAAVSGGDSPFSFPVLCQRDMNTTQQYVFDQYKDVLCDIYKMCLDEGHALLVDGPYADDIDYTHLMYSMKNGRTHVYHAKGKNGYTGKHHNKTGVAGNGEVRLDKGYSELLHLLDIFSTMDIDNMPSDFQRRLTKKMLNDLRPFTFQSSRPVLVIDAIREDMIGLPIASKFFLDDIINNGSIGLNGDLRTLYKMTLEGGEQVYRERNNLPTDSSANLNEGFCSNTLGKYIRDHLKILRNVDACIAAFPPRLREVILRLVIEAAEAHLAWAPGRLASCPPLFREAKEVIVREIFPNSDITDSFETVPVENPQTFDDCHNKDAYRDGVRQELAVENTKDKLTKVETHGGYFAGDENALGWVEFMGMTLVEYMSGKREELGEGLRWHIHWDFLGLTILFIDMHDESEMVRVAVVFCPFCNILFSKAGVQIDFARLESSDNAAQTAHWLKYFSAKLREPNASPITDKSFHDPISSNILFQFTVIHVHNTQMLHRPIKPSVVSVKNNFDPESN